MATEWVTIADFARRKGWRHETVLEKIKTGKIKKSSVHEFAGAKRIDWAMANKDLSETTDPAQAMSEQLKRRKKKSAADEDPEGLGDILPATRPKEIPKPTTKTEVIDGQETTVVVYPTEDTDPFANFRDAKTSSEQMRARKLELEVKEKEGRLLDIDDVRKTVTKLVSEVRAALNNLPSKISPVAVSITDVVEMETMLQKEINDTLASLSKLNEQLGDGDNESGNKK